MNKKKILILLAGVVLLLALLVFVSALPDKDSGTDGENPAKGTESMATEEPIYTADYDSLTKITLYFENEAYVFSKDGAIWLCRSHPDESFNKSRLGALATRLISIKSIDSIDAQGINPADCGIDLENPAISFECDLGEVSLYLGNTTAAYEGYYLMTSLSGDVYVITPQTYNLLFLPLADYKNEKVHKVDYEKISAIEFKNENCTFSLRLGKADMKEGIPYAWTMVSPLLMYARDAEITEKLIGPVSSISEKMYVSDKGDFENYGIGDKSNYMILIDSNGESQTVYFSSEIGGKCYMSIDESKYIYEADTEGSSYAKIRLIDIASRYLYINQQSNIQEVTVSTGTKNYTLDFSQSPHIIVNGNKITDSNECNEVFYSVCALLADDISTEPSGGADITITYKQKNSETVVVTFSDKDARYWSVSIDGKPIYTILKSKTDNTLEILEKYAK